MNREDIIRMAGEAGWEMDDSLVLEPEVIWYISQGQLERFAAILIGAKRKDLLDTIDELIGMERDRHPMFSEGYDHALHHIAQFVRARSGT